VGVSKDMMESRLFEDSWVERNESPSLSWDETTLKEDSPDKSLGFS